MPVTSKSKAAATFEEGKGLPLAAWDFDLCPDAELQVCLLFEYGKESELIREYVRKYRDYKRQGRSVPMLKAGFPFSAPILARFPDFPKKHWLEIPELVRRRLRSRTIGLIDFPPLPYSLGPSDRARFEREMSYWAIIKKEKAELLEGKRRGRTVEARRTEEREIERSYRKRIESVLYQLDWRKPDTELIDEFEHWLKLNRIHKPRPRAGGHTATDKDLLRALAAKRLLSFFSLPVKEWPKEYQNLRKDEALKDFVLDERRKNSRPAKPLYKDFKSYYSASRRAEKHLQLIELR